MRKNTLRLLSAALLGLMWGFSVSSASADEIPQLTQFLETEIGQAEASLEGIPVTPEAQFSFDEAWYYNRFWLRVRTPAGLDIPWLVKVQIIPEVELLWQRETPEGWGNYRP